MAILKAQVGTKLDRKLQRNQAISNTLSDTGTGFLNALKTFGMSAIGDAINGVSPKAADNVQKYTLGMIPHTSDEEYLANRSEADSKWFNRTHAAGNAAESQMAGAMIGKAIPMVINKVSPVVESVMSKIVKPKVPNPVSTGGILPEGLDSRKVADMINREKDWLKNPEYMRRKAAATGKSPEVINKETEQIMDRLNNTKIDFMTGKRPGAKGSYQASFKGTPVVEIYDGPLAQKASTLSHEIKHASSESAIGDRFYRKYPKADIGKWYDPFTDKARLRKWANQPFEQQVVSRRIMDFSEKFAGKPRGTKLTDFDVASAVDYADAQVNKGLWQNSDIAIIAREFRNKFGKDYLTKLTDLVNKAYVAPTAVAVAGAGLLKKK
jgi:hypothetical protein